MKLRYDLVYHYCAAQDLPGVRRILRQILQLEKEEEAAYLNDHINALVSQKKKDRPILESIQCVRGLLWTPGYLNNKEVPLGLTNSDGETHYFTTQQAEQAAEYFDDNDDPYLEKKVQFTSHPMIKYSVNKLEYMHSLKLRKEVYLWVNGRVLKKFKHVTNIQLN